MRKTPGWVRRRDDALPLWRLCPGHPAPGAAWCGEAAPTATQSLAGTCLSPGTSRPGGLQTGTARAAVAGPVHWGCGADLLYKDPAPGPGGARTDSTFLAHTPWPGLSLCGPGGGT